MAGLKTDVLRKSKNIKSNQDKYNLAASFQETINKILRKKTEVAMNKFREEISKNSTKSFVVAGGVAANETIRKNLKQLSKKMNFKPIFPSKEFCGDNAAMIAWAGIQRYKKKLFDNKNNFVRSRWPLDKNAPFLKGPGFKNLMKYWLSKLNQRNGLGKIKSKCNKKGSVWDGVRNFQARNNLKSMKLNDLCFLSYRKRKKNCWNSQSY